MYAGEKHNVDFHWSVPGVKPGTYRISLGIADGSLEEFRMCDYIEDVLAIQLGSSTNAGTSPSMGYFELRCSSVTIHRS
jgi:hypothetical protein